MRGVKLILLENLMQPPSAVPNILRDRSRRGFLLGLSATLTAALGARRAARAADADVPTIAAAADLNYALKEVADRFTKETGGEVKLAFGSSGNFTTQIRQSAPFELFLCADEEYVQALEKEGRTEGDGTLYAIGRIGLFAPTGSPLQVDSNLTDLAAALKDGRLQKFAIANPEHAPYGRAARAALQQAGLWEAIEPKLVLGENVSQATQFATSGSAQGGIIPLSLAKVPAVAQAGTFALIPETWHQPLARRRGPSARRSGRPSGPAVRSRRSPSGINQTRRASIRRARAAAAPGPTRNR
jgi:molybdate transport system substrate-binding protein